jgi:hypothetical protein
VSGPPALLDELESDAVLPEAPENTAAAQQISVGPALVSPAAVAETSRGRSARDAPFVATSIMHQPLMGNLFSGPSASRAILIPYSTDEGVTIDRFARLEGQ